MNIAAATNALNSPLNTLAQSPASLPASEDEGTGHVSATPAAVPAAPEPQLSEAGKVLSKLFEEASAFIQAEHLEPFKKERFDSRGYQIESSFVGAYINIEKYNNYLFEKAAKSLVKEAGAQGIQLDLKETIKQLKTDNADIAALKFDNEERRYLLGQSNAFSSLTYTDINALTDMYVTAKENGLPTSGQGAVRSGSVIGVAFQKAVWCADRSTLSENPELNYRHPDELASLMNELKDKMKSMGTGFGFEHEGDFFREISNPKLWQLNASSIPMFNFLLKLLDLKAEGKYISLSP